MRNEIKALVTGFDPFGGNAVNPSYEAVRLLPRHLHGLRVVTAQLPTSFARSVRQLRRLLARERPAIVLCTGLAEDRQAINMEYLAVNWRDARIADNDGDRPRGRRVIARAPAAYVSRLPLLPILKALNRAGIAAQLSMSAGTFVCNHVYFTLMHEASTGRNRRVVRRAGFVHVPSFSAHNRRAELKAYARALAIVLRVTRHSLVQRRELSLSVGGVQAPKRAARR